MSKQDMGGPAFPTYDIGHLQDDGMTLWDYYAAAALQGFCAKQGSYSEQEGTSFEAAAAQATAMLRERAKRQEGGDGE